MMLWMLLGPPGFNCWISFARYSVLWTVEFLYLLYLLYYSNLYVLGDNSDKVGIFLSNQTSMCLDKGEVGIVKQV